MMTKIILILILTLSLPTFGAPTRKCADVISEIFDGSKNENPELMEEFLKIQAGLTLSLIHI